VEGFLNNRRRNDEDYVIVPPTVQEMSIRPPRIAMGELPQEVKRVCTDDKFERLLHSRGRDATDLIPNVHGIMEEPVDLVAFPENETDIENVLRYCSSNHVACIPFGGGSSVVHGINPPSDSLGFRGTISLDMLKLSKVLQVDEKSLCVRVQGGVYGPDLEKELRKYGDYTFRYYPQSFEFSTVGGWLATRGGGHFATHQTHVDDLVESMRVVTPQGVTECKRLPGSGAGPSEFRQYLGSEGIYGVISEAWIRIRKRPKYRASATVVFSAQDSQQAFLNGAEAVRGVSQSGLLPANLRIVDGIEIMGMTGLKGTENSAVLLIGFESDQRSNMDAEMEHALSICRKAGGVVENDKKSGWTSKGGKGARTGIAGKWGSGFMSGGYLASENALLPVINNTLETAVTWDKFPSFYKAVNKAGKDLLDSTFGGGVITCRFTHVYPDGPAPYFTILAPAQVTPTDDRVRQWMKVKNGLTDVLIEYGATSTHHHAVGRLHRRHYDQERGQLFEASLAALKDVHDPQWVLNPEVLIGYRKAKL